MQMLTSTLRRSPIIAFFVLAYGLSWAVFVPAVLVLPSESLTVPVLIGGFGPLAAAVGVTGAAGGRASVTRWLRSIFTPRLHWGWLLLAVVLPLVIGLLQFGLYRLAGGRSSLAGLSPWYLYPVFLLVLALAGGGNEEPGWRGFGLPGLLMRFPPWAACAVLGVLHAGWHLPLMGSYIRIPFGWYLTQIIGMAIITGWLYLRSGSILPAMLLHGGTNALTSFISTPAPGEDFLPLTDDYDITRAVVIWAIAAALLLATRGRLGRPAAQAAERERSASAA